MSKAIALAVSRENPFQLALNSLRNSGRLALDALYGSRERVHRTVAVAFFAVILGYMLDSAAVQALQVCAF